MNRRDLLASDGLLGYALKLDVARALEGAAA